jgi:hypothetical protein
VHRATTANKMFAQWCGDVLLKVLSSFNAWCRGQDAASKPHHCANTNVVGKPVLGQREFQINERQMTNLISRLRLDSTQGNSKNIWLTFFLVLFLMMINFRALVIPIWTTILLTVIISSFQIISFFGYGYWTINNWRALNEDERLIKVLYFGLLALVTVGTSYIASKLIFNSRLWT